MKRLLALLVVLSLLAKPGVAQDQIPAADGSETDRHALCQQLAQSARVHLRGDRMADAMNVLGEAADLNLPFDEGLDDGLASAAAGWNRRLAGLASEERFDLLQAWSMPTESRRGVRVMTTITPTEAPPSVFALALGERPRDSSFAAPKIGEMQGLFCSAWELVKAADDAGALRRVTSELTRLADEDVANAKFTLMLARIVGARREDAQLLEELSDHLKAIKAFASTSPDARPVETNADLVIAAACLTQSWLQPIGEQILKAKLEQTYGAESPLMRSFLRYAHAAAIHKRYEATPGLAGGTDLELWVPGEWKTAANSVRGAVPAVWLAHQDHILHLTGPHNEILFFKYPLTGDFEFSCDSQLGGPRGTDGGIAYGGLEYEVSGERQKLRAWDANSRPLTDVHCPFVPSNSMATFNRLALKSTGDSVTLLANRHAMWTDASQDLTSPWIGLRSFAGRVPIFRNVGITGNPVIPREVKMSEGSSLRSWSAGYYGESIPPNAPTQFSVNAFLRQMTTSYDWSASDGVIQGARRVTPRESADQSRLYYVRPLQNGESISYEFFYEPDQFEVHPTLGRLALLIEPGGVRLHWMTDGEREWTGLAEDNAVVEPLNRRGPKPLPLSSGEWNRVTLDLNRDTLTLSLNDETIYTRKMEADSDRTFGFYHDKSRSTARLRNVVMRGDWPERLTQEHREALLALKNPDRSVPQRRALGAIFDDQQLHGSVLAVHRRAASMPDQARYEFLSDWVLPGVDHETLRLALDFTPTNPAPPVSDAGPQSGPTRSAIGGELVSPALDLIAVAKELGKLAELRERISAIKTTDDGQDRSQLAMLALVDIAAGDLASAGRSLDALAALVAASDSFAFSERWPETLAIYEGARLAETRDAVFDMALHILVNQVRKNLSSGYDAWDQHMRALGNRASYFNLLEREPSLRDSAFPLVNWFPTSRDLARTRGQGFPRSIWVQSAPATIENFASHEDDYLFYRIPLRGNFEVECDATSFGYREINLWVAGRWVGPVYTYRDVDVGMFREDQRLPLDPPIVHPDEWLRYRAVVRDGVCTTYFNGHKVNERALEAEHDPWLAIRSYDTTSGAVRNLRIIGTPEIPREVRLTANADLPGWLPINHGHHVGPNVKWQQSGDLERGGGIRGIRWSALPGSHQETMLRYHRPMVEDGTIEYEFYYREGEMHVHPALDRLAFMLQPDGVRIHWVTDDQFDRTGLAPDNLTEEPDNRRGPGVLPLKPDAWNRLQLSLAGDTVHLKLNDELVYERELEPTNQRTFGLFHYADRTEARVRNIVWRGDWPRELPAVTEQELAGEGTEFLDDKLAELTAVFEHDFVTDGLDMERFALDAGTLTDFNIQPDGLHVTRPGGEGYNNSSIAPRLTIGGDFDIVAEFDQFTADPSKGGSSGALLQAFLSSDKANECLLYRRHVWHGPDPQPIVQGSFVAREAVGARRVFLPSQVVEAPGGRLRLARRGDKVYFLFAENDSPYFRLFGSQAISSDDVHLFKLIVQTHLEGLTTVVWKSLAIRAERLEGLALQDQQQALAELNKERDALPQRFVHDFAADAMSETRFQTWGPFQPRDKKGVRVISIGTERWTSSGFNSLVGFEGDFDVAVTFDDLKLAKPKGQFDCSFYLQIEFPDAAKTQANVYVGQKADARQVSAQVRALDAGGNPQYRRIRTDEVDDIEKLRLVRRGKSVSFLYRAKGSDRDRILTQLDLLDLPVQHHNLRLLLHTGGEGRQSEVVLKQFSVRADKIDPNPSERPVNLPALGK